MHTDLAQSPLGPSPVTPSSYDNSTIARCFSNLMTLNMNNEEQRLQDRFYVEAIVHV